MCYGSFPMDFDAYYSRVQTAYDRVAPQYDDLVGSKAVSRRAKLVALQAIRAVTPAGGRLLDIGCYTGIEAFLLAQEGYRVVGIDLSPEMVRLARAKAARRRIDGYAEF